MKCVITTILLVLFNLALLGNKLGSSSAFYHEYELKIELEKVLENNNVFFDALAMSESTMNPDTFNSIGAMGMYQFMPKTLVGLGYKGITPYKFRCDPSIFPLEVQKEALDKKISEDLEQLEDQWFRTNDINYIEKYVGKPFKGIKNVTLAGVLAACHLGGVYGTMRFFDSNGRHNPADLLGSSIYHYLKKFSKYNYVPEEDIKAELQCLKVLEKDFKNITLLLRPFKWSMKENLSLDQGIVLTYLWQRPSHQAQDRESIEIWSHWDLRQPYQNTTEESYSLEVVPQVDTTIYLETELVRWNGIMQENGKVYSTLLTTRYKHLRILEYFNSTSSQYGMRLGMLNCHTFSPNFGFKKLRNFPHLGVA